MLKRHNRAGSDADLHRGKWRASTASQEQAVCLQRSGTSAISTPPGGSGLPVANVWVLLVLRFGAHSSLFCCSIFRLAAWSSGRTAFSPPQQCPASSGKSKPSVASFWQPATTLVGPMGILALNSILPMEVRLLGSFWFALFLLGCFLCWPRGT